MSSILQDVRYAIRALFQNKGFAAVAIVTLAIGIGVNTAIFSIVNAVVLQPLPFPEADRLLVVYEQHPAPVNRTRLSSENFLDLQRESHAFESLGGYIGTGFTFSSDGDPELVIGQMVSAELFTALGVPPLIGRTILPEENEGGRDQVLVLSHALWQRRFGGDPSVIGRVVTVNARPYTVVGVMPQQFEFPSKRYQLWAPFAFRNNAQGMVNRNARYLQVVGRLRSGMAPAQAEAELATIAARLEKAYPDENAGTVLRPASLVDETIGDVRPAMFLLWSVVGFVLLIACANVTNLLLARASAREREVAVRTALGAGRWRLVRQLLTETLVLYGVGALAGVLLAAWGLDLLIGLSPADIPRLDQTTLDRNTLLFTLAISLVTGLVFGILPALQTTKQTSSTSLRSTSRSVTAGRASRRVRATLVAAEVALSLMLLVGAALATRSLQHVLDVDPGLRTDGVLTFNLVPPQARYTDAASVIRFHRDVVERLQDQPGVLSAGASTHLPLSGQNMENGFTPEGWQPPAAGEQAVAGLRGVAGEYFDALGLRITAGRVFTAADDERAQPVVMVNGAFAARYWPGQEPVGKRLKMGSADSDDPWRVVVGVYADVKHSGPETVTRPEVMMPYAQSNASLITQWFRGLSFVVRTAGDPMSVLAVARNTVRAVDPGVPVVAPQRMSALLAASVAQPRFRSTLLLMFAMIAALLALVGIYGVVAFIVNQRAHEIGVRLALGAQRRDVLSLVMREGAMPIVAGIVIGLAGGVGIGRAMRSLLFEVAATDVATFVLMPSLLALVALIAILIPARRAMKVQPATALRAD
jgi:putative ABC transport system permease protein